MQFLAPIGLLALAGLVIPLIIHLWNVKQGKTLKIGSIALLGESSKASSKSLKINDWLLFVIRCLILCLIAFYLAQPYLEKKLTGTENTGWILVPKTQLKAALNSHQKQIDSLLSLGYELHDFDLGFKPLSMIDTSKIDVDSLNQKLNATSLLQGLNQTLPANFKVYLYAEQRLNQFQDQLPVVSYPLYWSPIHAPDTLSSWISSYADKKYEGKSNPSSTTYRVIDNGDMPALKVNIYQDGQRALDKKYLTAALKTIADFSKRELQINQAGQADVGFWLSTKPVTTTFKQTIRKNGNLILYADGKTITYASTLLINGKPVQLHQRIASTGDAEKIWTDGFGQPILTKETVDSLQVLKLYSRFNPQWSDLVWEESFVTALMPLVLSNGDSTEFGFEHHPDDQRTLSAEEKITRQQDVAVNVLKKENQFIHTPFWIAAFLMLLLERFLSFRQTKYANS